MTALLIIVGLYLGSHLIIFLRHGMGGLIGLYLITFGAWLYFYGYNSTFADFMWANIVSLFICTLGCFLPRGPLGIVVGGVGGYFIGRNLAKL